jgi:hypothetical protein
VLTVFGETKTRKCAPSWREAMCSNSKLKWDCFGCVIQMKKGLEVMSVGYFWEEPIACAESFPKEAQISLVSVHFDAFRWFSSFPRFCD